MIRLNGKHYTLPFGMAVKKYYCSKCGTILEKEKTHRVVTKDDKDYFRYHDYGSFPRRDYDVYDHRFKCPECRARFTYEEQCIIEIIQKKQGYVVLTASEIKSNYAEAKERSDKQILLKNILLPVVFALAAFVIFYIANTGKSTAYLMRASIFFLALAVIMAVCAIRKRKGKKHSKFKYAYPYEKEALLKKLHTYSVYNRNLIAVAGKCYCFHCKATVNGREIVRYADQGQTAICPKCGIDSIIPDSIDENVNEETIAEMNEYWF